MYTYRCTNSTYWCTIIRVYSVDTHSERERRRGRDMQSLGGSLDSDELVTRVEKMVLEHSRADDEEASRRRAGNDEERRREKRVAALVDHLLGDIYVRWTDYNEYCDPFTECSSTSDTFRHDEDDDDPLDQLTDRATLYDKGSRSAYRHACRNMHRCVGVTIGV